MMAVSRSQDLEIDAARQTSCRPRTTWELGALLVDHGKFIARSLRRLGVPQTELEDAVQEVFVVASRKIDAIAEGSERSFLYGAAMRIASNVRRVDRRAQARRSTESIEGAASDVDTSPSAEELLDQRDARAALDAVLETMSVELRAVFTLFELEELTTNEIAALLGVPAGTVSSRLRRAREHFDEQVRLLRAELERQGRMP